MGLFDRKNEMEKEDTTFKKDDVVSDEQVHVSTQGNSGSSISSGSAHKFGTTGSVRKLQSYHVNLIAIGGTVGTALFIYMGSGLVNGGPLNLLLGYIWWTSVIWAVAEGQTEMVAQWPTDAAFSRYASRYVDESIGFATGYNFFCSQAALVLFEVVAFGLVIGYWASAAAVSDALYITLTIVAYAALNLWSAKYFGNAEFCFAMGKVLLIIGLMLFTFIAMVGGNPQREPFGFTYWNNPGFMTGPAYAATHGAKTMRFEGFLAAVINACFTIAGPDYLSMVAGEAINPRKTMPRAFKATIYRLVIFFIGSALCIGILVPYDDPNLIGAIASSAPGGARSPYTIAMIRMAVPVLPAIVNALILTSVFSAGNAFLFCGSRTLAQMSCDGQAPKFFSKRNRNGVPYWSVTMVLAISLLGYCQLSSSAQVVITWLTGLVGSAQLVNWVVMSVTWIRWNHGLKSQNISRDTLYTRSPFQPFAAWYALVCSISVLLMQGYWVFLKDNWDTPSFIFAYAMPILFVILSVGWKVIKKTKFQRGGTMDVTSFVHDVEFDAPAPEDEPERGPVALRMHKVLQAVF